MTDKRIAPFRLGLFVLISLALGLIVLVVVGLVGPFEARQTYASFFDSPIKGLESGAPVQYLGIRVGKVGEVGLAPGDRMVRVLVKIRKDFKMDETMYLQVSQQMVSGLTSITLRQAEDGTELGPPNLPFDSEYPVLPNRPGDMAQLLETAQNVAEELERADFGALSEVADGWSQAGDHLADLTADPALRQTLENMREVSADLRVIARALGGGEAHDEWRGIRRDLAASAADLRRSSETLAAQLDEVPPGVLADISGRVGDAAAAGEEAVRSWDLQVDQSVRLLERTLQQVNLLLTEIDRLVRSLRREPGQVLERREETDPFAR